VNREHNTIVHHSKIDRRMAEMGHSRPMPPIVPPVHVRFGPKATYIRRCREMTRWAKLQKSPDLFDSSWRQRVEQRPGLLDCARYRWPASMKTRREISSASLEREMSRSESHSFLKYAAYLHLAPGKPSPIQSAAFIPGGGFTHSAGKCTMSTSLTILASASHLVRPAAFDCIA
jgi:hypothetical protein